MPAVGWVNLCCCVGLRIQTVQHQTVMSWCHIVRKLAIQSFVVQIVGHVSEQRAAWPHLPSQLNGSVYVQMGGMRFVP